MCALSFFLLSRVWYPSSAAQVRQVGLQLILPLLQGSIRLFPLPAPYPEAPVHRTLKGRLLPFYQDSLNPKGKDKWQERGQKGLQGL